MEIYATLKVVCLVQVGKYVRVGPSPIRPDPRSQYNKFMDMWVKKFKVHT